MRPSIINSNNLIKMHKKGICIATLFLLFISIVTSCISHKEYVENLAKDTVHNWLEWKYSPIGDIAYSMEDVDAMEKENGNWRISYKAYIQCIHKNYSSNIETIYGSVNLLLDYIDNEDRCVLTDVIFLP